MLKSLMNLCKEVMQIMTELKCSWIVYCYNIALHQALIGFFQPCHVVYTDYRPTPLQHYIFPAGGDGIHMVVDENVSQDKFYVDMYNRIKLSPQYGHITACCSWSLTGTLDHNCSKTPLAYISTSMYVQRHFIRDFITPWLLMVYHFTIPVNYVTCALINNLCPYQSNTYPFHVSI